MNKNLKKIIAVTLSVSALSVFEPVKYMNLFTTKAEAASDIYLNTININGDNIDLSRGKTEYKLDVSKSTDEVTIRVGTDDKEDDVTLSGDTKEDFEEYGTKRFRATVDLEEGVNTFKITVTDDDRENSRTYTLKIDRGGKSADDDIYLEKIALSDGNISFSPEQTDYNIDVASSVSKIVVQAKPEDKDYTVEIEGKEVGDYENYKKTVSLANGINDISIVITDDDDNERQYNLTVNRGGTTDTAVDAGQIDNSQDNIFLDDLQINNGDVKLNFNEKVTHYEVNVNEDVDSVIVKATPEDEDDTVRIDDYKVKDKYNKRVVLDKGKNTVKIIIDDQEKQENEKDYDEDDDNYFNNRTYTLVIYRGTSQGSANSNTAANTSNGSTASNSNTSTGSAEEANKWVLNNGKWQYNDTLGNPLKSSWYYDKGYGNNYYLDENGYMFIGWLYKDNSWYHLGNSGALETGWQLIGSSWYYLDSTGKMKTGWLQDTNGKYYYLTESGTMAVNTTVGGYKLGTDGAWIKA